MSTPDGEVIIRLCLVLPALLMLAACGGGSEDIAGVATYEPRGDGGDSALLEGALVRDGGCFYIESAEGIRFIPVSPRAPSEAPPKGSPTVAASTQSGMTSRSPVVRWVPARRLFLEAVSPTAVEGPSPSG